MAEILKITTPVINKNPIQPEKQAVNPSVPFDLQQTVKVIGANAQSELLKQNNGMIEGDGASTILMNLLKDPGVTVDFLKNLFLIQEIIRLLPINNQAVTQEIQQLYDSLLIGVENIVPEMQKQENTSTVFKGELFDFLREIVTENKGAEIRYAVSNFLKSINCLTGNRDVLDAIANGLTYLSESFSTSKSLGEKLASLAARFRREDAPGQFGEIKRETLALLKETGESILFTPKLAKIVSIVQYNLSRFNDNPDFFSESASALLTLLNGREKKELFTHKAHLFLQQLEREREQPAKADTSKIMDVLAKIIGKKAAGEEGELTLLNAQKVEGIIHSLLSSPCNFTPLLHFILPVDYMDLRSFAEIWIDPNGEGDEKQTDQGQKKIHALLVFDIEGIGQIEAELFARDKAVSLLLLCPSAYVAEFSAISRLLAGKLENSPYRMEEIRVDRLERPRSLMEVFKVLPHKRTGVDVKI